MDNTLPIVIVAPTKKAARKALRSFPISNWSDVPVVFIGNHGLRDLEGLRATRERTFFIDPANIWWSINRALEDLWEKSEFMERVRKQDALMEEFKRARGVE